MKPHLFEGKELHLAHLISHEGIPPVADVRLCFYHKKSKKPDMHYVKNHAYKWPLHVHIKDLFDSAEDARSRLLSKIETSCNEHSYQISQLWSALAEFDRGVRIDWRHPNAPEGLVITVGTEPKITPPEVAIRNPFTTLQDTIAAESARKRAQTRLVVTNALAAGQNAPSREIIGGVNTFYPGVEIPIEGPALLSGTEKDYIASTSPDVPAPIDAPDLRPVPSTPDDHEPGELHGRAPQPGKGKGTIKPAKHSKVLLDNVPLPPTKPVRHPPRKISE